MVWTATAIVIYQWELIIHVFKVCIHIYIYDLYIYRERERILTLKNGKTKNKHILVKSRHTLRRVALNTDMSSMTWRGGAGFGWCAARSFDCKTSYDSWAWSTSSWSVTSGLRGYSWNGMRWPFMIALKHVGTCSWETTTQFMRRYSRTQGALENWGELARSPAGDVRTASQCWLRLILYIYIFIKYHIYVYIYIYIYMPNKHRLNRLRTSFDCCPIHASLLAWLVLLFLLS